MDCCQNKYEHKFECYLQIRTSLAHVVIVLISMEVTDRLNKRNTFMLDRRRFHSIINCAGDDQFFIGFADSEEDCKYLLIKLKERINNEISRRIQLRGCYHAEFVEFLDSEITECSKFKSKDGGENEVSCN